MIYNQDYKIIIVRCQTFESVVLTADLRSLSCLLGFFAAEVMRFFILPKSAGKFYYSLKFIEVWICVCDQLSHKKIKVINFC